MKIGDKHALYNKLKGVENFEADKALLEKIKPGSKTLRRLHSVDRTKLQQDILWELLDIVSEEEILKARGIKPAEKLPKKAVKLPKPKPVTKGEGKGKGKAKDKEKPVEPAPAKPADGEKKEADQGAGIPEDQLGKSGESGHTEGNDPV